MVYYVYEMSSRFVAHGPGLQEGATVDEEEAVRIVSGEPPGYRHYPEKAARKTRR